jgi:two-component system, cell cycle response regulator
MPDGESRDLGWPTVRPILSAVPLREAQRRVTPILAAPVHRASRPRATLTVLSGARAGVLVSVPATGLTIGSAADADLVLNEPGVSRRHARVAQTSNGPFHLADLGSTNGTFVGSARVGVVLLGGGDIVRLGPEMRLRFAMLDAGEELLHRRLYDASVHDPLTRLFNRRYLAERLLAEVTDARRTHSELALLIADVDSLKEVNDRFGHMAGDRALSVIGRQMKATIRTEDTLARYGGDEFMIVAPGTGAIAALQLGERVRRGVEDLHLGARGQTIRMTVSVGTALLAEVAATDEPMVALVERADTRLYEAKARGRNRVSSPDT